VNLKKIARAAGLLALAAATGLGAGCGGIGASGSVSPATFLLPGLGHVPPPSPAPAEDGLTGDSPAAAVLAGGAVR